MDGYKSDSVRARELRKSQKEIRLTLDIKYSLFKSISHHLGQWLKQSSRAHASMLARFPSFFAHHP